MKAVWKVGQWLVIAAAVLSLGGLVLSEKANPQGDAQIADLVLLARTDLASQLGIQGEAIALESAAPLSFPCPPPNNCQGRQPGYIIRLQVGGLVYEYSGKILGTLRILWREVSDAPAV
jgi:hypothetical protein